MVKQKFLLLIGFVLFFTVFSFCSSKNLNTFKIEKNNILVIDDKVKINLKDSIEKVLKNIDSEYEIDYMPGYVCYNIKKLPIGFYVNNETKKIESIVFIFFQEERNKKILIKQIQLSDLEIIFSYNFKIQELKNVFNKKKIKFTSEEYSDYIDIMPENLTVISIKYLKKYLLGPWSLEVEIK